MSLLLKNISLPLANFTLEVDVEARSRVTAVFGPSGAGQTSLLDLIAGLRTPRFWRYPSGSRWTLRSAPDNWSWARHS